MVGHETNWRMLMYLGQFLHRAATDRDDQIHVVLKHRGRHVKRTQEFPEPPSSIEIPDLSAAAPL